MKNVAIGINEERAVNNLSEALDECKNNFEGRDIAYRYGYLSTAVDLALRPLRKLVENGREEIEKVYCFGCNEDVPADEYNHLKELCFDCIDRGR